MSLRLHTRLAVLASCAALVACSFAKFDDFEKKAPVQKLEQPNGSSATYAAAMLGQPRLREGAPEDGARVVVVSNGPAAFSVATFSSDGSVNNIQADDKSIRENFGAPTSFYAVAATPASAKKIDTVDGPFAYVSGNRGNGDKIMIADLVGFKVPKVIAPPDAALSDKRFGIGLASANLDGTADDLVVGARGEVILWPSGATWPDFAAAAAQRKVSSANWPTTDNSASDFSQIAVGNLDPSTPEDEIVVAAPGSDFVAVIYGVKACVDAPQNACGTVIELPKPADARGFGAALLIANVDKNADLELIVGAPDSGSGAGQPGSGRAYVYRFAAANFAGAGSAPTPQVVSPDTASTDFVGFGAALAAGAFDGGTQIRLAVSAPSSAVKGASKAGKIFLFDDQLSKTPTEILLVSATETDLLGRALTGMPFKVGSTVKDVLIGATQTAIYAFFSNTTDTHTDPRAQ